ncbi:MAG TPA: type II toxin-antitoxin system VapC family toxin [Terriglobia bacterium]|nr:type II toxin-antitoxin system VapC family toxin [Terriglobia bacterium]
MLNLDTHLVVALLDGSLNSREIALVSTEPLAVSPIVLWELAKLVQLGRLEIDLDSPEFREFLRQVSVIPLTLEIAQKSTQLDFQSDPADEIIAATSVVAGIPLLTRDRKILKSKLVPFP